MRRRHNRKLAQAIRCRFARELEGPSALPADGPLHLCDDFVTGFVRSSKARRSKLRLYEVFCGVAASTNSIDNSDAAVGVDRESNAGQLFSEKLYAID